MTAAPRAAVDAGQPSPQDDADSAAKQGLRQRLNRLQQQSGTRSPLAVAAAANAAPAAADQSSERERELARLRALLARRPGISSTAAAAIVAPAASRMDRELPGIRLAPGLRLVERVVDCEAPPAQFLPVTKNAEPVRSEQLLCFDTETTGLAGGSGTRAFMIGAADWHDGRLRLRQLYLDAMAGEPAMLDLFAGWLDADKVLVSYNGRSYDAPLLATRYRLARRPNPLTGLAHLDLLHPVRRRYRGCWENCRLATVERQLLHVVREDDLPGAQAPAAWLGYLRGGSAERLRRVVQHNAQDIVSLARLLCALHAPADSSG